jgi:hypothetical protein
MKKMILWQIIASVTMFSAFFISYDFGERRDTAAAATNTVAILALSIAFIFLKTDDFAIFAIAAFAVALASTVGAIVATSAITAVATIGAVAAVTAVAFSTRAEKDRGPSLPQVVGSYLAEATLLYGIIIISL